jgi:hypothetical protein
MNGIRTIGLIGAGDIGSQIAPCRARSAQGPCLGRAGRRSMNDLRNPVNYARRLELDMRRFDYEAIAARLRD